jgi:hypothetical protein
MKSIGLPPTPYSYAVPLAWRIVRYKAQPAAVCSGHGSRLVAYWSFSVRAPGQLGILERLGLDGRA